MRKNSYVDGTGDYTDTIRHTNMSGGSYRTCVAKKQNANGKPYSGIDTLTGEMDFKAAAIEEWYNLEMYAETRRQELSKTFESLVEAINAYEQLACRLVIALGQFAPSDSQDDALRDLFAEAFDSLHISKRLILEWLPSSTLALLRRAYEITSLFAYLVLNPTQIEKWQSGKIIRNQEIRRFLANHPMGALC